MPNNERFKVESTIASCTCSRQHQRCHCWTWTAGGLEQRRRAAAKAAWPLRPSARRRRAPHAGACPCRRLWQLRATVCDSFAQPLEFLMWWCAASCRSSMGRGAQGGRGVMPEGREAHAAGRRAQGGRGCTSEGERLRRRERIRGRPAGEVREHESAVGKAMLGKRVSLVYILEHQAPFGRPAMILK
jgi:hypothetical protein